MLIYYSKKCGAFGTVSLLKQMSVSGGLCFASKKSISQLYYLKMVGSQSKRGRIVN